ncbi:type II secretion system secretin GspD [Phycisphaerales bacterium AB-hyl4]|uniref:Type II secretion system secretin GspD n=1 Tax=Natronomicrosphaera hydrolytica TaxID=3242702 RepID=A0ABV4U1T0_9BACT
MLSQLRMGVCSLTVALVLLGVALPGHAQTEAGLTLNFRDAPLDAVLDYLSEEAGLVVVRSVDVEGRVTLISRQPLSLEDTIDVLNSVLAEQGYAAIHTGRSLRIVRRNDARRHDVPVHAGNDPAAIKVGEQIITQVIPIRHADARQLRDDLNPLLPEFATLTANERTNSLILTSSGSNVRRIVEIVSSLDRGLAAAVDVRVFALEYASARDAARLVNELFGEQSARRDQQERDPRRRFMRARGMIEDEDDNGGSPGVNVTASADERTNTVVVTGPPETLAIIEGVLEDLDANPAATQAVMVYSVKNGRAQQMAEVLNNLLQTANLVTRNGTNVRGGGGGGVAPRRGGGGGGGGGGGWRGGDAGDALPDPDNRLADAGLLAQLNGEDGRTMTDAPIWSQFDDREAAELLENASDLDGGISIVADPDTNTLILLTSSRNFEQLRGILDELDRPVPQVVIRVLIAEVTHERGLELGAEWSVINPRDSGQTTLFTSLNVAQEATQPGAGMVFRMLETDVQATIRALGRDSKIDVLSRPSILTSDNQEASIIVGNNVPFIRRSRTTDAGQVINDIEYEDIGIILTVTPHINPDGLVTLDVSPEISAITDSSIRISETVQAPIFSRRAANARVAVRDGQTIVIGGLMEDSKTQIVNKVPLLGDIPLLGALFRNTSDSLTKTELLIFLTPEVVKDPMTLEGLGDRELHNTDIVPEAVEPGALERHMRRMRPETSE